MPAVLLALALLAVLGLGIFWFLRASPSTMARALRPLLVVLGGIGVGGLLILSVRFLPSVLPELLGLAGMVATALIAQAPATAMPPSGHGVQRERWGALHCRRGGVMRAQCGSRCSR